MFIMELKHYHDYLTAGPVIQFEHISLLPLKVFSVNYAPSMCMFVKSRDWYTGVRRTREPVHPRTSPDPRASCQTQLYSEIP